MKKTEVDSNNDFINSLYEIYQDNLSIAILGNILSQFKNQESINAIEDFISDYSPIFIYEADIFFERNNFLEKNSFYRNINLKKKVENARMITTKLQTKKSKYIKNIKDEMGIELNGNIYDINIIEKDNSIVGANFSSFLKKKESEFWASCYSTNVEFVKVIMKYVMNYSQEEYYTIINNILKLNQKNIKYLDSNLEGNKYSYKSSKLFRYSNIQDNDKLFILYRINKLRTLIAIKDFFYRSKLTVESNNRVIINMNNFVNKAIALEIETLGNDMLTLNTKFAEILHQNLDNSILKINNDFYKNNRRLRNNIHYTTIDKEAKQIDNIELLQTKYLDLVYKYMQKELYFQLDDDDIMMNCFFKYCNENNIPNEEIDKNYENYYTQYYLTGKIKR